MRSSNKPKNNESKKASGVSFAKTIDIQFFQVPDDVDDREIWYTSEEYDDMEETYRQDVLRVHGKLRTPSGTVTDDSSKPTTRLLEDLEDECLTGIEHLLSVKIIKKVHACRRAHLNAVLQVQERLRQHNVGSMEESYDTVDALARVSKHYSRFSNKRAQIIGQYNARKQE